MVSPHCFLWGFAPRVRGLCPGGTKTPRQLGEAGQPARQLLSGHWASTFEVARGLAEGMDVQVLSCQGARKKNQDFNW